MAAVAGLSLVERAIVTAHAAGADEFYLVCGHNCRKLVAHLEDVARRRSLVIHPVFNADYRKGNGLSVLCAHEFLAAEPRFVLLMADHVFEPELLSGLFREDPGPDEVVLAVDRDLSNPLVELDDVTLVETSGGRVRAIGKGLDRYDGFDTGAFVCTPAVFEALEESVATGDTSLSGGMRLLAAADRLRARDVTGHMWIDVDTRGDQRRAQELAPRGAAQAGRRVRLEAAEPAAVSWVLTPGLVAVSGGASRRTRHQCWRSWSARRPAPCSQSVGLSRPGCWCICRASWTEAMGRSPAQAAGDGVRRVPRCSARPVRRRA